MRTRFGITTLFLVFVIAFCVKGTAVSKESDERVRQNRYYGSMEQEYLEKAKVLLNQQGYENCGVTMTRITEDNGDRAYTISIYHKKLKELESKEKQELTDLLSQNEFKDERCRFTYELP